MTPLIVPTWMRDGRKHGWWWDAKSPGAKKRLAPPRMVLLHHTAGEGACSTMYAWLKHENLSVHLHIDRDAVPTLLADPALTTCLHGGKVNPHSIGIEIANKGTPPFKPGFPRETYVDPITKREYLRFHSAQVVVALKVCDWLADTYKIPRAMLIDPAGNVSRRRMPIPEALKFAGFCGHMNVPSVKKKTDPSVHLLDDLATHWSLA